MSGRTGDTSRSQRYSASGAVVPLQGRRPSSAAAARRTGSSSLLRTRDGDASGAAAPPRQSSKRALLRTGSRPHTNFKIAALHRSESSRSLARAKEMAPMRFLQASALGGRVRPGSAGVARPRTTAWGDSSGSGPSESLLDKRPLDVPTIKRHPVSDRLQKYRTHDLLMSHAKRVSRLNDAEAEKASRAAMWQLSYREELAQDDGSGSGRSPRPVDGGGFLYHKMETQAEFDMHHLWVAKRKNEIARRKNDAEMKAALDEWQQHRNRIEAEIQRKIEAKRAPPPHPIPVVPATRQAYTPIPSGLPERPETDDTPSRPTSAASGRVTYERPVSRGSMGSRASRPASAGTRQRLATPVAIPRPKPKASRPPFGHYANPLPSRTHKPSGPPSDRFGPPGGPPPATSRPPLPDHNLARASAELASVDAELQTFERAAAARRQMPAPPLAVPAAAPDAPPQPPVRRMSVIAREQLDEVEAIKRAFAKHGMVAPEAALKRALVLTDDKPVEEAAALPAPGMALPENPLLEMKLRLFGGGKKKKGKKVGKKKGKKGGKKKGGKKKKLKKKK